MPGFHFFFRKNLLGNKFIKSLRFRIGILVIALGIIPAVLMEIVILRSYENQALDRRMAKLQSQCTILCDQISSSNFLEDRDSSEITSQLHQLSIIYDGRLLLISKDFRILEDTYNIDEGRTIISQDVFLCMEKGGASRYDKRENYISVTVPVLVDYETEGVLLASVSTDFLTDELDDLKAIAGITLVALVFIAFLLSFLISALVTRPFRRVTKSIEAVTEGYEDNYLTEQTYTETKVLSDRFNKMLDELKAFGDSRHEFVANVSHELKTPLTSMKVLADSLLSEEDVPVELYKEFMKDMSDEIERENQIINDLLTLVKMDKTADTMSIQPEDINEIVERILKQLRPIAAMRNIELVYESIRPVKAEVDESILSRAVTNLVENAIKYNVEGGWVKVGLDADYRAFYITVRDSGIGMSAEVMEHIFERFYRADKSHSSEVGGTGLGLAITRSAVVLHRGSVKVESEKGQGTLFTMRIPLTHVVSKKGGRK